jgi:hypothetical protein
MVVEHTRRLPKCPIVDNNYIKLLAVHIYGFRVYECIFSYNSYFNEQKGRNTLDILKLLYYSLAASRVQFVTDPSAHSQMQCCILTSACGWSWSSYCGRQTVDQFVWVSGLPLGPLTRFNLVLLFSADNYLIILSKASSLTRKRVCSLQ